MKATTSTTPLTTKQVQVVPNNSRSVSSLRKFRSAKYFSQQFSKGYETDYLKTNTNREVSPLPAPPANVSGSKKKLPLQSLRLCDVSAQSFQVQEELFDSCRFGTPRSMGGSFSLSNTPYKSPLLHDKHPNRLLSGGKSSSFEATTMSESRSTGKYMMLGFYSKNPLDEEDEDEEEDMEDSFLGMTDTNEKDESLSQTTTQQYSMSRVTSFVKPLKHSSAAATASSPFTTGEFQCSSPTTASSRHSQVSKDRKYWGQSGTMMSSQSETRSKFKQSLKGKSMCNPPSLGGKRSSVEVQDRRRDVTSTDKFTSDKAHVLPGVPVVQEQLADISTQLKLQCEQFQQFMREQQLLSQQQFFAQQQQLMQQQRLQAAAQTTASMQYFNKTISSSSIATSQLSNTLSNPQLLASGFPQSPQPLLLPQPLLQQIHNVVEQFTDQNYCSTKIRAATREEDNSSSTNKRLQSSSQRKKWDIVRTEEEKKNSFCVLNSSSSSQPLEVVQKKPVRMDIFWNESQTNQAGGAGGFKDSTNKKTTGTTSTTTTSSNNDLQDMFQTRRGDLLKRLENEKKQKSVQVAKRSRSSTNSPSKKDLAHLRKDMIKQLSLADKLQKEKQQQQGSLPTMSLHLNTHSKNNIIVKKIDMPVVTAIPSPSFLEAIKENSVTSSTISSAMPSPRMNLEGSLLQPNYLSVPSTSHLVIEKRLSTKPNEQRLPVGEQAKQLKAEVVKAKAAVPQTTTATTSSAQQHQPIANDNTFSTLKQQDVSQVTAFEHYPQSFKKPVFLNSATSLSSSSFSPNSPFVWAQPSERITELPSSQLELAKQSTPLSQTALQNNQVQLASPLVINAPLPSYSPYYSIVSPTAKPSFTAISQTVQAERTTSPSIDRFHIYSSYLNYPREPLKDLNSRISIASNDASKRANRYKEKESEVSSAKRV